MKFKVRFILEGFGYSENEEHADTYDEAAAKTVEYWKPRSVKILAETPRIPSDTEQATMDRDERDEARKEAAREAKETERDLA